MVLPQPFSFCGELCSGAQFVQFQDCVCACSSIQEEGYPQSHWCTGSSRPCVESIVGVAAKSVRP